MEIPLLKGGVARAGQEVPSECRIKVNPLHETVLDEEYVAVNGQHRDRKGSESSKSLVSAEYTVRVSKHRGHETSMGASDVCPG